MMIRQIFESLQGIEDLRVEHLSFHFTPDFKTVRHGSLSKLVELFRVIKRALILRCRGEIDVLVYPAGGPQTVPIIRDIFLLPWMLLIARRVILHFHAAGIADRCSEGQGVLCRLLASLYRRCHVAIVMTEFNRRDPASMGVSDVRVIPNQISDEVEPAPCCRSGPTRLLYVGHLCEDKGTGALLEAFSRMRLSNPELVLELVGECLPPFNADELRARIHSLRIEQRVELRGLLTGREKLDAYGRADLFVFPSVAPYESFGLVMIEAMRAGLPLVVTDWRGNAEVAGKGEGGVITFVGADLVGNLHSALERALSLRKMWPLWGAANRKRFEQRYCARGYNREFAKLLLEQAKATRSTGHPTNTT